MIVFLKITFEKVDFEKSQQTTTKACKITNMQRVKWGSRMAKGVDSDQEQSISAQEYVSI